MVQKASCQLNKVQRAGGDKFVTQFRESMTYASSVNTLANIKKKDNKTLREHFEQFNEEVLKV